MTHKRWRLFCFDLDGTLIPGTTSCQHLAERLGHADALGELESLYTANKISNRQVADESAFHYRGFTVGEIATYMRSVPLLDGIADAMALLKDKGIPSLLTTVTWRFAAAAIADRFGFDGYSGTEMSEDESGRLSGFVSRHFDEFDKRDFVVGYCAKRGIAASDVVAIGDSRSDVPLFGWAGYSIALNANAAAKAIATIALDTHDLREVLRAIPYL